MPLRDGRGPWWLGTGRGKCRDGFSFPGNSHLGIGVRKGWLLSMAVPFVAAVIRDVLNPSGMIWQIARVKTMQNTTCQATRKHIQNADYVVTDDTTVTISRKKDTFE